MTIRVGMVGARGYVGEELLQLIEGHPGFETAWVASRTEAGRSLQEVLDNSDLPDLAFRSIPPTEIAAHPADLIVLALPNGAAADYVAHLGDTPVIDLSADYRFDADWSYGLPELGRDPLRGARRVANPGCYATAAQLALAPVAGDWTEAPFVFGISGFSGAGRNPNERNDPERLRDNILPYALTGHLHEREIIARLGGAVRFTPHVAGFFRGISVTASATLKDKTSTRAMIDRLQRFYADAPLVEVTHEIPEVQQIQGRPGARIGGFTVETSDPRRVVWICVLDNLLKGAASQALQNMNLMFGFNELEGIADD